MKCLLIINKKSGNSISASDNGALIRALKDRYGFVTVKYIEKGETLDIKSELRDAEILAVAGGDGTLNSAVNAVKDRDVKIIYIPCGTVNDAYHTAKSVEKTSDGNPVFLTPLSFNDKLFTYVAATGTFTPIGWRPKDNAKKHFKRLAYFVYAFKEYKINNLGAQIIINGKSLKDTFTLIMAVKSKYVFGFPFNRAYRSDEYGGHILLIKTPKGALKFIKLFLLFFRAFFIGFNAEYESKNISFRAFKSLSILLDNTADFCLDGERESGVKAAKIGTVSKQIEVEQLPR